MEKDHGDHDASPSWLCFVLLDPTRQGQENVSNSNVFTYKDEAISADELILGMNQLTVASN